jgi:glycosyltransferase involved in cell wall biosynthesis
MRIAILNSNARVVGGIESYLDGAIRALAARGDDIALLFDYDQPHERNKIAAETGITRWSTSALGSSRAIDELRRWRPDVIFAHGLASSSDLAAAAEITPAAYFAHDYRATCISGFKRFAAPIEQPCARRFGPGCLPRFFPLRCGGLNPSTMLADYRRAAANLAAIRRYRAVLTASRHMRAELLNHGFTPETVHCVGLPIAGRPIEPLEVGDSSHATPSRMLFAARMESVKGGHLLIGAAARAVATLDRPLTLAMVGDGSDRPRLEFLARSAMARESRLKINFEGWLDSDALSARLRATDLVVIPSIWPEPFGMTGLEAGIFGIPACAFAVGAIPEWLEDGVNGHLAHADPPSPESLAMAIVKCLADSEHYLRMRKAARTIALSYSMTAHLRALDSVFASLRESVSSGSRANPA